MFVLVNGSWEQICGCDTTMKKKRDTTMDTQFAGSNDMIEPEGTISRLWTGLKNLLGQESNDEINK